MNDKTIRVLINPDGISCREVNPLGEKPTVDDPNPASQYFGAAMDKVQVWNVVEISLRSFEIEGVDAMGKVKINAHSVYGFKMKLEPGTIHEAEILESGKVKIIS